MKRVIIILTISIILLNLIILSVYAFDTSAYNPSGLTTSKLDTIGGKIIYVFQRVGTYFAVGVLAFIGIQYMIGSPSEKADIKGRAVPYLVGAIMVFAIVNLLQIVYNIVH